MTFRPAPLRAAAALAVVFVAARVIYRVLFNGAGAGSVLLLDLPPVRLPGPFAHVAVFGPVTAEGLWQAAVSALPIAGMILGFGLLNSLVDVARGFVFLARGGPLQGIARMLVVAWAALPALYDAVGSVRLAFKLRGERFGPRALVPVLERTLEHAARVAAALELRGFGSRTMRQSDGGNHLTNENEPPLLVRDAHFRIADTRLSVPELTPSPGTISVITGPTGSGKSTILRGLAGLLSHVDGGAVTGTVQVAGMDRASTPPRDTAGTIGVVLQNPRAAFATTRVRDEIGLALELRGMPSAARKERVTEVAQRIGVTALLDRTVSTLSAGEATLVAIAAATVQHPALLLVDEPLADLDSSARHRVINVLSILAREEQVCVIAAEHRADALAGVADAWWTINDGALVPGAPPAASSSASASVSEHAAPAWATDRAPVLTAANLSVHRDGKPLVSDASLTLHRGEIVALVGPNGAGKSSLLVALALGEGNHGESTLDGGRVALVPDASDDLFTRDTVAAELRTAEKRALRRSGSGSAVEQSAVSRLAVLRGGVTMPIGHEHPRDLSAGERRILAIALQTTDDPQVLLIDEPTRGLDPAARAAVSTALRVAADAGTAVLIATHDLEFAHGLGARILPMNEGVAPAPVEAREPYERVDSLPQGSAPLTGSPRAATSAVQGTITAPQAIKQRTTVPTPAPAPAHKRRMPRAAELTVLGVANLLALAAFCWPLLATALPQDAAAATPYIAMAIAPVAVIAVAVFLDGSVRSAHMVALLGVLAAIGSAVRVASTGVGGVEAVFILLILAGRAYGPRFGLLLGAATIAVSSVLWGGIGPWTPFQIFACAWVGAGAGLLPRRVRGRAELWMLCGYGIIASYVFGLLTNLWFWPFAVGAGTGISYIAGAPLGTNLSSFLLYSLLTSTAGWDTLRAVTTVIGIAVVGRAILAALRRAKPLTP